jgi:hypothetical protein
MKARKTAHFFDHGTSGLFLASHVVRAEKTFSPSFMKTPVRTGASSLDMKRRVSASPDLGGPALIK